MRLLSAFPPGTSRCLHFVLSNQRSCLSRGVLFRGPLPSPCHATSPLHYWTTSPPQQISPGSVALAPAPLPSRSVAVTWLFSRSLSAAPGSPPQSNDAMAAIAAPAPARASNARQVRLHPAANGLPQAAGSRATTTAAERRRGGSGAEGAVPGSGGEGRAWGVGCVRGRSQGRGRTVRVSQVALWPALHVPGVGSREGELSQWTLACC